MNGSVRPSVCHTFFTMFCDRIIMKISGAIITDQNDVNAKVQGQRSKVTEIKKKSPQFEPLL